MTGSDCAIARAIKEQLSLQLRRIPDVYVDRSTVAIDGRFMPATPEISEFVKKFDKDKSLVSPVTITISPYIPYIRNVEPMKSFSNSYIVKYEGI